MLKCAAGGAFCLSTPLANIEYLHCSAATRSPDAATAFAKSCALGGSNGVLCTEVQQQLGLWSQTLLSRLFVRLKVMLVASTDDRGRKNSPCVYVLLRQEVVRHNCKAVIELCLCV